jgi:RNA polymerase sigma-70 factor (ECF subfamily)
MLKIALSRLPHELREILLLREFEEMPYDQISAALGICEGTVKSRIARARKALLSVYEHKKADQQGNSYE